MRVWALMVALLMASLPPSPVSAQNSLTGLRASGSSFMFARYSTEGASALYAARGFGPVSVVVGAVQNHRSGYREAMLGALSAIAYGTQAVTVAVAFTDATDAPYVQLYAMPAISAGALSASATVLLYQPLDGSGVRQFELSPMMLLARLCSWLGFGGSYSLGIMTGSPASQRLGVAVRVQFKLGTVTAEILRDMERGNNELRLSLWTGY